ncbi:hypothetical protein [Legionella septentrionalis]|uniref:hypothetical protein n=1 Tax=Legionella septentrionalis TaxID=2498109 RepID=UPI000F8C927B|nr:hypothetical protein [Legionella septentrionalis]RUR12200.1 hypothetical protein ELY10_11675 [Legionella septentrionalis]
MDEANNHLIYKIDFPFGNTQDIRITAWLARDLPRRSEFFRSLSADNSILQTYSLSREKVERQYPLERTNVEIFSATSIESSYKKALSSLELDFGINVTSDWDDPILFPDFHIENTPINWNPFARLFESKRFPFARLSSSSLWQRIKDCFFILHGDFLKNDLGILDYIFPIPRLLINLLAFNIPLVGKIAIGVLAGAAFTIKFALALAVTMILSPMIGLIDLALKLLAPVRNELDQIIKIKPIKGSIESFYDVLPDDLEEEISLTSFQKIHKNLTIKPLATTAAHYEEITPRRPLIENNENLNFGVYADETPLAIMELNAQNKPGIFNLMRTNRYKIDTHLEDVIPPYNCSSQN